MNKRDVLPRVLLAHVAFIGLLVVVPFVKQCSWFKKPPLEVMQIDLASLPPPPPDAPEDPEEQEPDPVEKMKFHVQQTPGLSYPAPATDVFIREKTMHQMHINRQPPGNMVRFQKNMIEQHH